MGSGFGEGDNRAVEAAQEAISSPLLDDLSSQGALGVLINITGGMDLAIDEVHTISTIIQEEAGDDAEIIFGAVHDPELEGKIRVTVIATGFDQAVEDTGNVIAGNFGTSIPARPQMAQPIQQPVVQPRVAVAGGESLGGVVPAARLPEQVVTREQLVELDIPTFIRRQMD